MTAITTIRAALRPAGDTLSGGGEDARQQALEEAARVADAEEISCRETLANRRTEMEHVSWAAAANTARLLAKAIRSLKATAPTIPLSTGGWKPIETSPRAEGAYADIWNGAPYHSRVPNASLRKGQWCTYDAEWGYDPVPNPTHWMPLPEPPPGE